METPDLYIKTEPELVPCASTSSQSESPPVEHLEPVEHLCRLCGSIPERTVEIYSAEGISNELSDKINEYLPVKVSPEDKLPLCCCWNCVSTLISFHDLVISCVEAEKRLQCIVEEQPKPIPILIPPEGLNANSSEPNDEETEIMDEDTEMMEEDDEYDPENEEDDSEEEEEAESKPMIPGTSDDTESDISIADEELLIKSEDQCQSNGSALSNNEEGENKLSKNDTLKKQRKNTNGKVRYECDVCHNTSSSAKKFVIHYLSHNKDKSRIYTCDHCLQRFTQPGNLKRHIEVVHLRIRKFSCKICETTFTTKATRDDHMTTHYDGRSNVCTVCDKSFESKRALRTHRQSHLGRSEHSNERKTCATCNESFKLKQSLKRHIERKHLQLKYYCEVCKKLFTNKYNRDKHIKIHLNFCDICGKKFTDKSDLRMHKLFHVEKKI